MSKKLILVLAGVIFFSSFRLAFASVIINEVRINNGEFVELYNSGNNDVSLGNYYFTYYSSSKTNWNAPYRSQKFPDTSTIKGQSFYLIAMGQYSNKFDWQPYTSNQLSDTDGTVALWSDDPTKSSSQRLDAFGWGNVSLFEGQAFSLPVSIPVGNSFGRIPDGLDTNNNATDFVLNLATPGAINQISPVSSTATTPSVDSGTQSMGGPLVTGYIPPSPNPISTSNSATNSQIKIQITGNNYAFAGVPTTLKVEALQSNQAELNYGKYFLNFGDGDSKEVKMNGLSDTATFNHTYFYPGDYIVTAEYYNNSYSDIPDVTAKVVIDTVPNDITISKVGDDQDFFIELSNNTVYDADLSDWILASGAKSFTLPQNTIIQAKKTLMLSSKITSFSVADENTLKLMTPQNELVFDYAASIAPTTTPPLAPLLNQGGDGGGNSTSPDKGTGGVASSYPDPLLNKERAKAVPEIPATNLTASAISSNSTNNPAKNNSRAVLIFILSFVFIGASAGAVYFIRRKKIIPQTGNDFKILDE